MSAKMPAVAALLLFTVFGCSASQDAPGPGPAKSAVENKPILGPAELHYLRQALRCMKMTPEDLLYRKNSMPGLPYRLQVVDRLMTNPLDVPFYADEVARGVDRQQDLPALIDYAAAQIDLAPGAADPEATARARADASRELLGKLEGLPDGLKEALLDLLSAMHESGELVKAALAGLTPEGREKLEKKGENIEEWEGYEPVVREKIILAGRVMAAAVEKALPGLRGLKAGEGKSAGEFGLDESRVKGKILFYAKTAVGEIVVGGSGANEYRDDFALMVDVGGDDRYLCRAGGTDGRVQPPVAVCIDLGGKDEFAAPLKVKPTEHPETDKLQRADDRIDFCQGGAIAGVGILVVEGDEGDTFAAGSWSQGAGRLGVGILLRRGNGNDSYQGLDEVQGAGSFGLGILKDEGGADKYHAAFASQGFGGPAGLGLLRDATGDDNYYAGGRYEDFPQRPKGSFIAMSQGFGYGLRPGCSGGIGLMLDDAGDDFRHLDNEFGMGGSYWYGLGVLVDDAGNDTYQTGKTGDYDGYTMGAAIHLAAACLIDRAGNDRYHGNMIGPAVGWDLSPGWLVDGGGDDEFTANKTPWNFMAAGVQNGCGFLVKKGGTARFDGGSYPCGQQERDSGSIGILLNLGGHGTYASPTPRMQPDAWWGGTSWEGAISWCVGIDTAVPADFKADESAADWPRRETPTTKKYDEPALEGIDKVERPAGAALPISAEEFTKLWDDCVKEQGANWDKSTAARDKLKALGLPALYEVIPKLTSPNYYETLCASGFIVPLCKSDPAALPVVLEHLRLKDKAIRRSIIGVLGDTGDPRATAAILPLLTHPGFMDICCVALGKLRDKSAVPALLDLSKTEMCRDLEGVRKLVAVALGNIADPAAVPHLIQALDETYFWVRYPAEKALIQIGAPAVPALMEVVAAGKFPSCAHALEALGRIKDSRAWPTLVKNLENPDWAMRAFAAEALGDLGDKRACELLEKLKPSDPHPFVRHKAAWAIEKLTAPPKEVPK